MSDSNSHGNGKAPGSTASNVTTAAKRAYCWREPSSGRRAVSSAERESLNTVALATLVARQHGEANTAASTICGGQLFSCLDLSVARGTEHLSPCRHANQKKRKRGYHACTTVADGRENVVKGSTANPRKHTRPNATMVWMFVLENG